MKRRRRAEAQRRLRRQQRHGGEGEHQRRQRYRRAEAQRQRFNSGTEASASLSDVSGVGAQKYSKGIGASSGTEAKASLSHVNAVGAQKYSKGIGASSGMEASASCSDKSGVGAQKYIKGIGTSSGTEATAGFSQADGVGAQNHSDSVGDNSDTETSSSLSDFNVGSPKSSEGVGDNNGFSQRRPGDRVSQPRRARACAPSWQSRRGSLERQASELREEFWQLAPWIVTHRVEFALALRAFEAVKHRFGSLLCVAPHERAIVRGARRGAQLNGDVSSLQAEVYGVAERSLEFCRYSRSTTPPEFPMASAFTHGILGALLRQHLSVYSRVSLGRRQRPDGGRRGPHCKFVRRGRIGAEDQGARGSV